MSTHVYCTSCKYIKYALECLNRQLEERDCNKCPCNRCNCYDIEDSRNDRPNYTPIDDFKN